MSSPETVAWDYLTGTTDVVSDLRTNLNQEGVQELLFNIRGTHTLRLPLNDFLLCWRLFNMVFYSRILGSLDICINTECKQIPYGAHQKTDECPGKSAWQRQQDEIHETKVRELQRQEKLRIASLGGENGN